VVKRQNVPHGSGTRRSPLGVVEIILRHRTQNAFAYGNVRDDMAWETDRIVGPDGQDWRVPVSELEARQTRLSRKLAENGIESILIDDPVELYWLTGGRQNSLLLIGSDDSKIENTHWVRRSKKRAIFESGGGNSPHITEAHPRMANLEESLVEAGCTRKPGLLEGKIPHSRWIFVNSKMPDIPGESQDCTNLLYELREVKSDWEVAMIRESGEINRTMFEEIHNSGGLGKTEVEMAGLADAISRSAGFGGRIRMRKWPMDCDRVVITAGHSGAIPSYFDSAVGGLGASPISSLGAGFAKVEEGQPVLVDIVHVHTGYVSDCTRMFCAGKMPDRWANLLDDMIEISNELTDSLAKGDECSTAWGKGSEMIAEMGHSENLMGMPPNQAKFLGHSVGLELDETPVIAKGFDRSLPLSGIMAIEPKLVFDDGAIGIEDTWVRTEDGMHCLTAGENFPMISEW